MPPRVFSLFVFLTAMFSSLFIAPALAQTNGRDLLLLAQRLAGGAQKTVTVDALPPGWTSPVPLPALPILGSISGDNGVTVLYSPTDAGAAFDSYTAELTAAGYKLAFPMMSAPTTGFISSAPVPIRPRVYAMFCRADEKMLVNVFSSGAGDLRVDFLPRGSSPCGFVATPVTRPFSPLPAITMPAGTALIPYPTNTISAGTGSGFESITSSASISGSLTIRPLLAAILSQLRAGGWTVVSKLANSDEALARLSFERGSERWRGNLSIVSGVKPQMYSARIDAVKTTLQSYRGLTAAQMGLTSRSTVLPWVPKSISKSDQPVLLQLIRQLVSINGYRPAQVYFQKIPAGFPIRVPLPEATPLAGAVVQLQPVVSGQREYNLYYRLTRAQLQSYTQRLQTGGWKKQQSILTVPNGFQYAYFPRVMTFCSKSMPSVNISGAVNSSAFIVKVLQIRNAFSCDTMQALRPGQTSANPLPRLDAPDGTQMLVASAGIPTGNSGAVITTAQSIAALLGAFNTKFTQKGWTVAASTSSADLASSSYTYRDMQAGGQKWQAVLTLYRSFANSGQYYAFIDLTKLP